MSCVNLAKVNPGSIRRLVRETQDLNTEAHTHEVPERHVGVPVDSKGVWDMTLPPGNVEVPAGMKVENVPTTAVGLEWGTSSQKEKAQAAGTKDMPTGVVELTWGTFSNSGPKDRNLPKA